MSWTKTLASLARKHINPGVGLSAYQLAGRNAQGHQYAHRLQAPLSETRREKGLLEDYFDQHHEGQGIWKWRHYFDVYHRHFAKFRGNSPTVLEVGLYSGGSIGMWRDYFGEGLRIIGVDIEPACRAYESSDVTIHIGDQADRAFWANLELPPLDIVIDDGGHEPDQQIATLEALLPRLKPGGVYLCEDVAGTENPFQSYIAGLSRTLNDFGTVAGSYRRQPHPFQQAVDSVHLYPYVTVIERRAHRLNELVAERHGTIWQPFYQPSETPEPV